MTINPSDSDPADLRAAAREELGSRDVDDLRSKIAAEAEDEPTSVDAADVKELLLLESGADPADLSRPFLSAVPDGYAGRLTLFEWLDFVLRRAGVRRTLEAIEYYETVGWIAEEAAADLRDHVRAFREVASGAESAPLRTPDHVVSLVYIARLASLRS